MTISQPPEVLENSVLEAEREETVSPEIQNRLREALSRQYPHLAATMAPSKQTATDRKGRQKDEEAAEDAPKKITRSWRQPSFMTQQVQGRADFPGNDRI